MLVVILKKPRILGEKTQKEFVKVNAKRETNEVTLVVILKKSQEFRKNAERNRPSKRKLSLTSIAVHVSFGNGGP